MRAKSFPKGASREAFGILPKSVALAWLAVAVLLAGVSAFAMSGRRPEQTDELPNDEYAAFVMAHGNAVYFLGVNMYPLEPLRWDRFGWVSSDGPQVVGQTYRTRSMEVKLSHPIGGHEKAQLTSGRDGASSVDYLNVGETVERKFSFGAEKHWVEKTAGEIAALTGIPIAIVDVQSNKWINAFGTNATLRVQVEASACTRRIDGGPEQAITDRRVIVTPRFRRKAKPVSKPSEIPDPEVDVDI